MNREDIHIPLLSRSLRGNGVEEVPKGFVSWYNIQEKICSDYFKKIDILLSNNEPYAAIEIFEDVTTYNPNKVWH